ncbi:hypothetical protein [Kribbella sp. DT2]|uniref:hypothetical protein n=1 Tax=Kribbella sp. DT2 TaxID=3393427 RepID=UPI003CF2FA18
MSPDDRQDGASREARARAAYLAYELLDGGPVRDLIAHDEGGFADEDQAVPADDDRTALADVEQDAAWFRQQLALLSELGLEVPALTVEPSAGSRPDAGVVPISLDLLERAQGGRSWTDSIAGLRYGTEPHEQVRDQLSRRFTAYGRLEHRFRLIPHDVARQQVRARLTGFLAVRIVAETGEQRDRAPLMRLPRRRGHPATAVPGCTFEVTTNTPGLRVFWSGAYFLTSNYFSAPTSPASSTLQSGTYLFGVDGGAYRTVTWDTSAQVTLPGNPSVHLNF